LLLRERILAVGSNLDPNDNVTFKLPIVVNTSKPLGYRMDPSYLSQYEMRELIVKDKEIMVKEIFIRIKEI